MDPQLDLEASAIATKLEELRIDIGAAPDSPAPEAFVPPKALTVSVAELPTPPFSPPAEDKTFTLDAPSVPLQDTPLPEPFTSFPLFPLLPPELRNHIWSLSHLPRTIELHSLRTHYADDFSRHSTPRWQSTSRNPTTLSVCLESRLSALAHYTIALPLCLPHTGPFLVGDARDGDRILYFNPEEDTLVLLGDLNYGRLAFLMEWVRKQEHATTRKRRKEGRGKGLRRIAMSVAPWSHMVGAQTLKAFARTVFADVEEFVLFVYKESVPPGEWKGGRVVLEEADEEEDSYRRFVVGRGMQFREGERWMVVGKRPIKVVDIKFLEGW